jgi:hypothetical protein
MRLCPHGPVGAARVGTYDGSKRSPLARIAHRMPACLLATATSVRYQPTRAWSPTIRRESRSVHRWAVVTAERAPWNSSVRRYVLPCLVMRPSRVLPPLLACLGTVPSQAANWRPFLNTRASRRAARCRRASRAWRPARRNRRFADQGPAGAPSLAPAQCARHRSYRGPFLQ